MARVRHLAAALVVVAALPACAPAGPVARPASSPTGDPDLWRRDPAEPYPFVTPIPPRAPTPVDGAYARDYRQGSTPIPCRRCAPYRLDSGRATMRLQAGRYHLEHLASAFRAAGHYVIHGERLVLFNDPNCPEVRGEYRWRLEGDALVLVAVEDACAFDLLRARYLSAAPWERTSE